MRQAFYTSKFYISKKSEKEVCFKLNFEIEISGGGEKIYTLLLYSINFLNCLFNKIKAKINCHFYFY